MPPKKVRQTADTGNKPTEKSVVNVQQPQKQQSKSQPKIVPENQSNVQNTPSSKLELKISTISQAQQETKNVKSQKIAFDDLQKLTEQQRLKLRRLRFGIIGTDTTGVQTEKIKEERLKKFGTSSHNEDPETLQKRKKKFSNTPQMLEDNQTIQQRLKKFGQVSQLIVAEDQSLIEERKKKFGNTEKDVNLDELIEKSKKIKKGFNRHHNNGRNNYHKSFGNRFRH